MTLPKRLDNMIDETDRAELITDALALIDWESIGDPDAFTASLLKSMNRIFDVGVRYGYTLNQGDDANENTEASATEVAT